MKGVNLIDNTISKTTYGDISGPGGRCGLERAFELDVIQRRAGIFHTEQDAIARRSADPAAPREIFKINMRLTIRFVSPETWRTYSEEMISNPAKHIYLHNLRSMIPQVLPPTPTKKTTLESVMKRMLENAGTDHGVVTFKVGPEGVRFQANSCIIQSRIGVPLLRDGLAESREMEINLPHVRVDVFKIFLEFLYTQRLSDADMRWFARELYVLADQYNVPDLIFQVEYYLCWITQVAPPFGSV